jgi:hypothetical protein
MIRVKKVENIRKVVIIVIITLCVGIGIGLFFASRSVCGFWNSFFPNFFSNIIGVSLAAIIGIPTGLAVNQHFVEQTEGKRHKAQVILVKDRLITVKTELEGHIRLFNHVATIFSPAVTREGSAQNPPAVQIPPSEIVNCKFPDIVGTNFLMDNSALDIGEATLVSTLSLYYFNLKALNETLALRAVQSIQLESWNYSIYALNQKTWSIQPTTLQSVLDGITRLASQEP